MSTPHQYIDSHFGIPSSKFERHALEVWCKNSRVWISAIPTDQYRSMAVRVPGQEFALMLSVLGP